jgi:hypothetical protein
MKDRIIEWGSHERLILDKVFGPLCVPNIAVSIQKGDLVIEVQQEDENGDWTDTWAEIYRR